MSVTALRARATCTSCSSRLPPRTDAWWDEETRSAMCLSCARVEGLLDTTSAAELLVTGQAATAGTSIPDDASVEAGAPTAETGSEAAPEVVSEPEPVTEAEPEAATGSEPETEPLSEAGEAVPDEVDESSQEPTDAQRKRPPLPPRVPVATLRPARNMGTAVAALRRFPSQGATAMEPAADDVGDHDASREAEKVPALRQADPLPLGEGNELDTGTDAAESAGRKGAETGEAGAETEEPRYVQSAAELIGRLRSVRNTPVNADSRVPLVVERPEQTLDRGRIDDTRVTQTLEAARIHGVEVLHHRGKNIGVEIEHLVVAVNGIWVVVEQESLTGPLEKRDLGDWFTADARLFVGEEDRTELVVGAREQAESVRTVISETSFANVPVRPVICFGTVPPAWVREPFVVGGVSVTWRNHLVEPMLDPVLIDRDARHRLVEMLVTGIG